MSRILCLAPSGFGKTTGIGKDEELGLEGLDPESTYVLSVTSKPLPFRGSTKIYPIAKADETGVVRLSTGKRAISNDPLQVATWIIGLYSVPHIKVVVWDDANYIMQDWYMQNALAKGWDAPKQIGFFMGKIFEAMELYQSPDKHIITLAHSEVVKNPDGREYWKFKTTGKMVDEYVTPEGKYDVTLLGVSRYDSAQKKVVKEYITRENDQFSSAKSPRGMFEDKISNDLGKIVKAVDAYYNAEV